MKPQPNTTVLAASKLAMHRDSHVISKLKPKIRIIHLLAPEIIKTDEASFRELVQRLTGKTAPAERKIHPEKTRSFPTKELRIFCPKPSKKIESDNGVNTLHNGNRMTKQSEKIWGGENSNWFMGGFGDMDSLIQDLGEFPLLPLQFSHSNAYGGMALFQ